MYIVFGGGTLYLILFTILLSKFLKVIKEYEKMTERLMHKKGEEGIIGEKKV